MLADMFRYKSLNSALLFDDKGGQAQSLLVEYGKLKFPWVYENMPERKETSSIPGLSPEESAEAERMIAIYRRMQEEKKKAEKK